MQVHGLEYLFLDMAEGRDAIQGDLNKRERWDHVNIMRFKKAKLKVLH